MVKPILSISNLNKSFHERKIFENVNFDIFENEIIGLLGFSGAGKTTLLNIMCGFVKPDFGEITNNMGETLFENNLEIKSMIGFSSQNPSVYYDLTVYDNLEYFATLENVDKKIIPERIHEILEKLDLHDFKKTVAKDLSEGMKKRLDIACSIIDKPKILILDEPTSNLDYKLRDGLLEYIKKINKEGTTIIFVSHYLDEIKNICSRILIIKDKKIISKEISELKDSF